MLTWTWDPTRWFKEFYRQCTNGMQYWWEKHFSRPAISINPKTGHLHIGRFDSRMCTSQTKPGLGGQPIDSTLFKALKKAMDYADKKHVEITGLVVDTYVSEKQKAGKSHPHLYYVTPNHLDNLFSLIQQTADAKGKTDLRFQQVFINSYGVETPSEKQKFRMSLGQRKQGDTLGKTEDQAVTPKDLTKIACKHSCFLGARIHVSPTTLNNNTNVYPFGANPADFHPQLVLDPKAPEFEYKGQAPTTQSRKKNWAQVVKEEKYENHQGQEISSFT